MSLPSSVVMASSEMFLDRGALVWDAATQRSCLDAFAGTADDAARARPRSNLTAKFDVMLDRTRAAEAGGAPVASGFQWMANQAAKRHWPRFVDGCAKNGVRLLFLLRRNVLRQLVSRTLNQADRDRTSPTYAHHAHPDDDARLAQQRRARATLPEGARLGSTRKAWYCQSIGTLSATIPPPAGPPRVLLVRTLVTPDPSTAQWCR